MKILHRLADNQQNNSIATRLRRKRFAFFRSLLLTLDRPITILDVGGVQPFWERMGFLDRNDINVVLLNLTHSDISHPSFVSLVGDARSMREFKDKEFDVVFSNSVIEHVGTYADQCRMAEEVQRVGKRYFIQTPNRYFPIEPHFLVPFFQFLPVSVRVFLLRHFDLGWCKRTPDKQAAFEMVRSIRLLTEREVKQLFPAATLYQEKFLGLTKSFVAYEGWRS